MPIECVYSVLEVKAHLTIEELERCFVNMKSIRRLEKKAYYPTKEKYIHTLYGNNWKIWPVNYYVFAYDSIKLERLGKFIDDKHKEEQLAVTSRIDSLCIFNKGIITNRLASGTFDALPQKNSQLGHYYTSKALLLFYTLIIRYINQIGMPDFRFKDYLGQLTF
jgi:hypothetical protein